LKWIFMPLRHKHRSVMDLRRLKTFAAVAEHGTVLRAAQVLHITQPALSRQIAGLEQEVGFELFERIGRRLLLTPRGEQFLKDSRSLLAHADLPQAQGARQLADGSGHHGPGGVRAAAAEADRACRDLKNNQREPRDNARRA
jgi:DNA-binding transcriptional LysR family regulator